MSDDIARSEHDEHLVADEAEEQTEDRFEINSDDRANWLLGRLLDIDTRKAAIQANSNAMLKRLDADRDALMARFGDELKHYAEVRLQGARSKTLRFFYGDCAFRTVPSSVRIVDREAAIEYAGEHHRDLVTLRPVFDGYGYRRLAARALAEDGEVWPGVKVVPERESFTVRPGSEGSRP